MIKFIHDSWEGVMNMDKNPLRHINDLQVRHLTIQLLAWMWCITFSLYFGSFVVFGYTAAAHFIFIVDTSFLAKQLHCFSRNSSPTLNDQIVI